MTFPAYIVAFFWVFGFFPAALFYQEHRRNRPYSRRADLAMTAYFVLYLIAGAAIVSWVAETA